MNTHSSTTAAAFAIAFAFLATTNAHADRTLQECSALLECAERCESTSDVACLDTCGIPEEMRPVMSDFEATCEMAQFPDIEQCEELQMVVLFVCIGVDVSCVEASRCIDSCGETFDLTCTSTCLNDNLEGETLQAAEGFYGCAAENCGSITDQEAQGECVERNCSQENQAFMEACNFDALDDAFSDGTGGDSDSEANEVVCDEFMRCAYGCTDDGDWSCYSACTDNLPEGPAVQPIVDFIACAEAAGCTSLQDEECLVENCSERAMELNRYCGDGDDGGGTGTEDSDAMSSECTNFIECLQSCDSWGCLDACQASNVQDARVNTAIDAIQACGIANGCAAGDNGCLERNCAAEFQRFERACTPPSDSEGEGDENEDGSGFKPECESFDRCIQSCDSWECLDECQSSLVTDADVNAAIDAIQACGNENSCEFDYDSSCIADNCTSNFEQFENACANGGGSSGSTDSEQGGDSTGEPTDDSGDASASESGDEDSGCQSAGLSNTLTLFGLLGLLILMRSRTHQVRKAPIPSRRRLRR